MKKLLLGSIALVMIVLALAGCGKTTSSSSATTKELTFNGQTYTVPKDPQKIAVLSNSVLSMLYAVDGKAISRANTTDKLAPELEALPALGQTANINMEPVSYTHLYHFTFRKWRLYTNLCINRNSIKMT